MGLTSTIFGARQLVNHGHVRVDGKKVNIASYQVTEGQEISLRERSQQMVAVLETVQKPERGVPDYIEFNTSELKGKFIRVPKLADVPYPAQMQPNFVVEFYSR